MNKEDIIKENIVWYHCHSDLSNLTAGTSADSVTSFDKYIDKAKDLGMKAISISEHGSMVHWLKKQEYANSLGLKYIHGMEAYITKTADPDKTERDNYHLGMYAKNWAGMQELLKLSSKSFEGRTVESEDGKHFYYNPRITVAELFDTSDNIIITTACLGSPLWQLYKKANQNIKSLSVAEEASNAQEKLNEFIDFFAKNKHRVFLELQYHCHPEQIEYNDFLFRLHQQYGIPLIAGSDSHSLDKKHAEGRNIYLMAKGATYGDEDTFDLTAPSVEEFIERFEKQNSLPEHIYLEALHNTNVFAEMFEEFEVDRSNKYPRLHDNPLELFKQQINEGFVKRGINKKPNKAEYLQRIHEELEVYEKVDAIDYMLLQKQVIDWANEQNISHGASRGSVSGSLIAYLIGVTEMDSVKHKLNFFRFLNPARISLADIDVDYRSDRRNEVIDYVSTIEGIYFSEIVTFNTMKTKGAIKEVARALHIPIWEANDIADNYEENESHYRSKYEELFYYVDILQGSIVSMGTHPSGYVVSPIPLDENIGTLWTKESGHAVSQLNMKELDSLNYVKFDLLGLDNVWLIADTCKLAGIPELTPDTVDLEDEKVWRSMANDTLGVFQMESKSATSILSSLFSESTLNKIQSQMSTKINYLSLLSMANGAIRPSGASYRDALSLGEFKDNGHIALNEYLQDSMGYMIFQETIMTWLVDFCGYTESQSDLVRRAIGKKTGTEQLIPEIKSGFIATMKEKYGTSNEEAEKLAESFLQVILDASDYSFSLNHSQAYSIIGYMCTYLKTYYPNEFITTMLNIQATKSKDLDKTPQVMQWAKAHGIQINKITFGKSRGKYNLDKETRQIYKGLASIKFLNETVAEELYDLADKIKEKDIQFVDLLREMREKTSIRTNQLEILIRLRYFEMFGDEQLLLKLADEFYNGKFRYDIKLAEKTKKVRMLALRQIEAMLRTVKLSKTSLEELLNFEIETLGYISTTYPSVPDNLYYVVEINSKYTPKIKLYRLSDGEELTVKMYKKKFHQQLITEEGTELISQTIYECDTIQVLETMSKPAMYKDKITGKWIESDRIDDYILDFKVIRKSSKRAKTKED